LYKEKLERHYQKVLAQRSNIMEDIKIFQIMKTKRKEILEIFSKYKIILWPVKKLKEKQTKKYYRNNVVNIEDKTSCKRCVYAKHKCLAHYSR